jgi:hypothetical protein
MRKLIAALAAERIRGMEIDQYRPAGGQGGWKGMEDGKQPIQVPIR